LNYVCVADHIYVIRLVLSRVPDVAHCDPLNLTVCLVMECTKFLLTEITLHTISNE